MHCSLVRYTQMSNAQLKHLIPGALAHLASTKSAPMVLCLTLHLKEVGLEGCAPGAPTPRARRAT